jgi:hypothetical protein
MRVVLKNHSMLLDRSLEKAIRPILRGRYAATADVLVRNEEQLRCSASMKWPSHLEIHYGMSAQEIAVIEAQRRSWHSTLSVSIWVPPPSPLEILAGGKEWALSERMLTLLAEAAHVKPRRALLQASIRWDLSKLTAAG